MATPTPTKPPAAHAHWGLIGLVVAALGIAHLGLGLVLTRGARGAIGEIESAWTPEQLEAARDPGPQPDPGSSGYGVWTRERRLWDEVTALGERQGQVRALSLGLWGSFLVQACIVGWAGLKAARRSTEDPRAVRNQG